MADERVGMPYFMGAVIALAVLVAFIFLPELNVIILGITLAVLFYPFYEWLARHMRGNASAAALVVVLVAIILILAPLLFFGLQLFWEVQSLYTKLSSGTGLPVLTFRTFSVDLNTYARQALGNVVSNFGQIFSELAAVVTTFALSFFALYYFLKDGGALRAQVIKRFPAAHEQADEILRKLHVIMSSIVQVSLFMAVVYGVVVGVGFALFGVPSAILWGGVTVLAAFIPVFGVFLVAIPGMLFLGAYAHLSAAIGLAIWTFAMVAILEEFLRPRLLGRKTSIHPLLMLFAVLGGLSFFGPIGILLGPIALGLLLSIFEAYPLLFAERPKKKVR